MAGNQWGEDWTLEKSEKFMQKAVELSKSLEFDFIGEVAKAQDSYHMVYTYIVTKFPQLKKYLNQVKSNCESNCFYNGKKGDITPSLAIMNLKSNHGWTDRADVTTQGEKIEQATPTIIFKKFNEQTD